MVLLHTGLLVAAPLEVVLADRPFLPWLGWPMLAVVLAAQALRWWCIATLGVRWNTRVIVVPGLPLVTGGPYRWLRHPNYVAVVAEGIALPLVHTAWVTALVFTVLNAWLLTVRIGDREPCTGNRARRRSALVSGDVDVLVVGGGPVGLAAAVLAAERGLSAAVVERRQDPVDKACGEGLMPSAVAALQRIGADPPGVAFAGIRYVSADGHRSASAYFRGGQGRGVRRTALVAELAGRVDALGVKRLHDEVVRLRSAPGVVVAQLAGHGEVAGSWLLGADGLHSTVRRWVGGSTAARVRPRYGLRRHFVVEPWTDLVEVHWAAGAEAYVTPVGAARGGRRDPHRRPGSGPRRVARGVPRARRAAAGGGADLARARRGTAGAERRQARGRPGAPRRRRGRLRGRADRGGHRPRHGHGGRRRRLRRHRPARALRTDVARRDPALPRTHQGGALRGAARAAADGGRPGGAAGCRRCTAPPSAPWPERVRRLEGRGQVRPSDSCASKRVGFPPSSIHRACSTSNPESRSVRTTASSSSTTTATGASRASRRIVSSLVCRAGAPVPVAAHVQVAGGQLMTVEPTSRVAAAPLGASGHPDDREPARAELRDHGDALGKDRVVDRRVEEAVPVLGPPVQERQPVAHVGHDPVDVDDGVPGRGGCSRLDRCVRLRTRHRVHARHRTGGTVAA